MPFSRKNRIKNIFFIPQKAEASQKMKEETVTLQKKPASEKTRDFLMNETSLKYEYELYHFVVDRIKRIQHKYNVQV